MNRENGISDELISAFVDNQLALEDKEELYARTSQDAGVNRQVCEIRKVRDLVQTAYRDVPEAPSASPTDSTGGNSSWRNLAAGFVLAAGVLIGWQLNNSDSEKPGTQLAVNGNAEQVKVLFHLNSYKAEAVSEALNEVESVLQHYNRTGQNAIVEFVTNGNGLTLLRKDVTRHAEQIKAMQRKYPNLVFVACQNTIDRLKKEHNITAKLLDGVMVIDSGVAQIMRRQQQGWAYIQVS